MLNVRKPSSWIAAAAALAVVAGGVAWAADDMAAGDLSQSVMKCTDQMKQMAADPAEMTKMRDGMAKMMVMDHMAMKVAMDPQCKDQIKAAMADENVKKAHEAAMAMAKDPEQSKKMMDEIMADPMAMKMVLHTAMMMEMKHEKMGDKMKDMGGKMDGDMK